VSAESWNSRRQNRALRSGERNECGPMFINIGDGGNREGLSDFLDPQPPWSAAREPSYGHGAPAGAVWQLHEIRPC